MLRYLVLGGIGLAVVQGARQAKAGRIIVIDTNPDKFEPAKQLSRQNSLVRPISLILKTMISRSSK